MHQHATVATTDTKLCARLSKIVFTFIFPVHVCYLVIVQSFYLEEFVADVQNGGPKKWHKVYSTIVLQPYVTESCGCQQNVWKEIAHVTEVSV